MFGVYIYSNPPLWAGSNPRSVKHNAVTLTSEFTLS